MAFRTQQPVLYNRPCQDSDRPASGSQPDPNQFCSDAQVAPAPNFCTHQDTCSADTVLESVSMPEYAVPSTQAVLDLQDGSVAAPASMATQPSAGKTVDVVSAADTVGPFEKEGSEETPHSPQAHTVSVEAAATCSGAKPRSQQCVRPTTVSDAVVLELFAGSANLSKAFRSVGMQVIAVDTKDAHQIKIVKLNLLHKNSVALVLRLLETRKILFVHMAPPCSTSSQARMIQRTARDPKPLRSWQEPDGLTGLSFLDRNRVSQANRLYQVCVDVALACQTHNIWWSIENPTSSFMWITSPFRSLWTSLGQRIKFATFHNCVYGGDRKKSTTLWTSCQDLQGLSCICSQDYEHVHAGWGRQADGSWATSKEASYPPGLCSQFASLVFQAALSSGRLVQAEGSESLFLTKAQAGIERAAQGLFPRGSQMPPLVDPFPEKVWHEVPAECDRSVFVPGKRLQGTSFPKGSTTLAVAHWAGSWWAQVGIPVTPEKFLSLSAQSKHPESFGPVLPPILRNSVERYCSMSPWDLSNLRVKVLKSLLCKMEELKAQESRLHRNLAPHARDVLKGKRLLLFQELLCNMEFPDATLVDDMQAGFRITGWLPDTNTRPTKVVVPTLNCSDLWSIRTDNNSRMWSMCTSSGDESTDWALWQQTLKECESGWATLHVGLTQAPTSSILSRRFAVQQHDKVRPIDDFSVSQVNHTLGYVEKIMVMPSSSTVSLSLALQRGLTATSRHGRAGGDVTLTGKTFDLKSAYKQLPLHSEDLPFAQATVWNPEAKRPAVVSLKALPFGATGSVQGFCRCSIAIWAVVLFYLIIPSTVFFDDYTSVVSSSDSSSSEAAFVLLMRILGWKVAADKGQPFARLFQSLGISFLLPRSPTDPVQVSNTDQRRKELASVCLSILRNSRASPHKCSVFAGRLRWMEGQTFGRLGRKFFRTILAAGDPPSDCRRRRLDASLRQAFDWILCNVPKAAPKCFWQPTGKSFQLFTDGSFESGRGEMAGVLCRGSGHPWQFWRAKVPAKLVARWSQDGVERPIMQCELLAAAVSLGLWGSVLSASHVTLWIDNDAARHSIISAQAYPRSNMLIVQSCLVSEVDYNLRIWIARVPSISNPADAPSRGEIPEFLQCATEVNVEVGMLWRLAEGLSSK